MSSILVCKIPTSESHPYFALPRLDRGINGRSGDPVVVAVAVVVAFGERAGRTDGRTTEKAEKGDRGGFLAAALAMASSVAVIELCAANSIRRRDVSPQSGPLIDIS